MRFLKKVMAQEKDPTYLAAETVKMALNSIKEFGAPVERQAIGMTYFPIKNSNSAIYVNTQYGEGKSITYRIWKQDGPKHVGKDVVVSNLMALRKAVEDFLSD